MGSSIDRGPPRRAAASGLLRSSPSGTGRGGPGRLGLLAGRGLGRRRIPGRSELVKYLCLRNFKTLIIFQDSDWWVRFKGEEKTYQGLVSDQLPGEPQEGLLEVVVGLGRDVVVLQVLLAVESDGLGLDFALLNVDLVAGQDDRDVFADADEVTYETKVSPVAFGTDVLQIPRPG